MGFRESVAVMRVFIAEYEIIDLMSLFKVKAISWSGMFEWSTSSYVLKRNRLGGLKYIKIFSYECDNYII